MMKVVIPSADARPMSIELRHLRYFLAVAETLHFGRAAERLGMSQPPLSQQIRQLETLLGARLFLRANRRVELTDAGRVLQEQAREVLARVDTAIDLTQRAQRGETGELRIGLTRATPLSTQIPRAIFAYRQQFPQVQLKLREMNTLQQIDALMAGELDVGLIRKRALPAPLMSRKLFSDPLALVVHDQHPLVRDLPTDAAVALRLFAHEPFVGFLREVGAGIHDHFIALCRSAGFTPRIVQEAGEASTLISLAASGLGVTVLPASCSHIQVDGARFVALSDRAASSEVHVACRRGAASPLIGHFTRLLQGVSG